VLIGRCFLQLADSAAHLVGQSLHQAPRPPPFIFEPSLNGIEPFVHADFNAIEQLFEPLDVKIACFSSTKRSGRVGVGLSRSVGRVVTGRLLMAGKSLGFVAGLFPDPFYPR